MRLPWRRRKDARVVFIGSSPFDVPPPAPLPVPPAPPAPEPSSHVEFGFVDGTTMALNDDDPRAIALREVADRLTGTREVT